MPREETVKYRREDRMSKAAFICPLYDMKNHFDLALNLYRSKLEYEIDADMIFIFSNEEHKDKFAQRLKDELGVGDMLYNIMPDKLSVYKAKAVTKKLYGLKTFMNEYDYIIMTDCEAVFIKHFDAGKLAEEIWNSRNMLASNISPDGFFIMRKCYKTMGLYYNKKLRKALGGFTYNFWFNDLQVYKCSYLCGFFDWLKNFDIEKICNTWDCFEFYVFYAYLCLVHDMQIKKYHYICMGGINEYMDIFSTEKQKRILEDMGLHWTSSKEDVSDQIVMRFHLDRSKESGGYGYSSDMNYITIKLIIKRYLILLKELPEMIRSK